VVKEEETTTLSSARLKAISDQLVQSGVGEERIITEQVDAIQKSKQGAVEIRFFE
jgi:type IV pilus biogenesis protein CpaD/CtpE